MLLLCSKPSSTGRSSRRPFEALNQKGGQKSMGRRQNIAKKMTTQMVELKPFELTEVERIQNLRLSDETCRQATDRVDIGGQHQATGLI